MSGFSRLLKNSIANVINGFSNVILGIVISPFLIKNLSLDEFSIWSICLQAGIAISIFATAGQVTVGRFTSKVKFSHNSLEFTRLINNYTNIMLYLFLFCLLIIFTVTYNFEYLFSNIPEDLIFSSRITFLLVTASFVIGIFSTVFIGYFIGIEKNHIPAKVNVISRTCIGILIVLFSQHGLIAIASIYFVINIISYGFLYKQFSMFEVHSFELGVQGKIKGLLGFFSGLAIWNIAQFLISGIGVFVVSIYDFENLAFFVLAMTMVNAIVGLLGAVTNPIIQPIVKLNESGSHNKVDELIIALSLIFSLVILVGVNFSSYVSLYILQAWVGIENGLAANEYFNYLLVAFSIRMIIAPYGMKLIANAEQLKVAHYPVVEGVLNFIFSIYFLKAFGAIGIAYSTMLSALIIMSVYAFKYSREIILRAKSVNIFLIFVILPGITLITVFLSQTLSDKYSLYICGFQLLALLPIAYLLKKYILKVKGIVNETKAVY